MTAATPTRRRDWPVAFVIAAVITACLIFLALYGQAQRLMCATHRNAGHGALQYCPDFTPTTTTETTR